MLRERLLPLVASLPAADVAVPASKATSTLCVDSSATGNRTGAAFDVGVEVTTETGAIKVRDPERYLSDRVCRNCDHLVLSAEILTSRPAPLLTTLVASCAEPVVVALCRRFV